jgi:two-component system OmpR family response regulator
VLELLRSRHPATQVLMLTARGAVEDRVEGLDRGADDYLVKPYSFAELSARQRALERRPKWATAEAAGGALVLDLMHRTASVNDRRMDLTPTEFALLAELVRARGSILTRRDLLRGIWGYEFDPGTNVVDVHVNRLRRKLEERGLDDAVQTVRGQGYGIC